MTIETKYSKGDYVYHIENDIILRSQITDVAYSKGKVIYEFKGGMYKKPENRVASTKDELFYKFFEDKDFSDDAVS